MSPTFLVAVVVVVLGTMFTSQSPGMGVDDVGLDVKLFLDLPRNSKGSVSVGEVPVCLDV